MKVLAGDIGGTSARLALCDVEGETVRRDNQAFYASRNYSSLAEIAREFITEHQVQGVSVACFGVPGPVRGRRADITNLPWKIDADQLERNTGIDEITLINDLEATARGLRTLAEADFRDLRPAQGHVDGNQGLVAAGTGLGVAGLFWDGRRHRAFASEGGHTDFSPSNDREAELLAWLRADLGGHVSWERVVSGGGLERLYRFLRDADPTREREETAELLRETSDAAEIIHKQATRGDDELCHEALEWFMELYGAEAGNVALKYFAVGGMFVGGGIAPKIADSLAQSRFVSRFDGKGRMQGLLEQVGIRIVMNESAALQGAAYHGARKARGERG